MTTQQTSSAFEEYHPKKQPGRKKSEFGRYRDCPRCKKRVSSQLFVMDWEHCSNCHTPNDLHVQSPELSKIMVGFDAHEKKFILKEAFANVRQRQFEEAERKLLQEQERKHRERLACSL